MSSYNTTIDAHGAVETKAPHAKGKGFWARFYERMVAARMAQAEREVAYYLERLDEQHRKDLGFPTVKDRR